MRVFLSGVIQGSQNGTGIENQGYRQRLAALLRAWRPDVEIIDPWVIWPDAVDYDMAKATATLLEELALAAQAAGPLPLAQAGLRHAVQADALVAYLPVASMGTALEMWSAYRAGVPVYTITTMNRNWAVNALSTRVFDSLEAFAAFVQAGGLLMPNTGADSGLKPTVLER